MTVCILIIKPEYALTPHPTPASHFNWAYFRPSTPTLRPSFRRTPLPRDLIRPILKPASSRPEQRPRLVNSIKANPSPNPNPNSNPNSNPNPNQSVGCMPPSLKEVLCHLKPNPNSNPNPNSLKEVLCTNPNPNPNSLKEVLCSAMRTTCSVVRASLVELHAQVLS